MYMIVTKKNEIDVIAEKDRLRLPPSRSNPFQRLEPSILTCSSESSLLSLVWMRTIVTWGALGKMDYRPRAAGLCHIRMPRVSWAWSDGVIVAHLLP